MKEHLIMFIMDIYGIISCPLLQAYMNGHFVVCYTRVDILLLVPIIGVCGGAFICIVGIHGGSTLFIIVGMYWIEGLFLVSIIGIYEGAFHYLCSVDRVLSSYAPAIKAAKSAL
jgi:hypothetical protein